MDLDRRGPDWIGLDIIIWGPSAAGLLRSPYAALCNNYLLPMSNVDLYSAILGFGWGVELRQHDNFRLRDTCRGISFTPFANGIKFSPLLLELGMANDKESRESSCEETDHACK